jgi:hypothetical protein
MGSPPSPPPAKVSETIEFQTFACNAPLPEELQIKYKKVNGLLGGNLRGTLIPHADLAVYSSINFPLL